MDNQTLNSKFNRLYQGSSNTIQPASCLNLNFRVSDRYMCPDVGQGEAALNASPSPALFNSNSNSGWLQNQFNQTQSDNKNGTQSKNKSKTNSLGTNMNMNMNTNANLNTNNNMNVNATANTRVKVNGANTTTPSVAALTPTPAPAPTASTDSSWSLSKLLEIFHSLSNNPDFQYSQNLVMTGGNGLKEYFMAHLDEAVEVVDQLGGAVANSQGLDYNAIISNFQQTIKDLTKIARTVTSQLDKTTVGETIETFVSAYQTGTLPVLSRDVRRRLGDLQGDAELYSHLLTTMLSNVRVNDVITTCAKLLQQPEVQQIAQQLTQTGGALTNVIEQRSYVAPSVNDVTLHQLFDSLRENINYLTSNARTFLIRRSAPRRTIADVDTLRKGLLICLQIIQYQLQVGGPRPIAGPQYLTSPMPMPTPAPARRMMMSENYRQSQSQDPRRYPQMNQPQPRPPFIKQDKLSGGNCGLGLGLGRCGHGRGHEMNLNNRHYLGSRCVNSDQIVPSVYFDPSVEPIAKHPQRRRRLCESDIPNDLSMRPSQHLSDKCLSCTQPCWHKRCY